MRCRLFPAQDPNRSYNRNNPNPEKRNCLGENSFQKGGILKKTIGVTVLVVFLFLSVGTAGAGILGDINNDGKVDLAEAMYALQVASGIYPELPDSCILVGRDSWTNGEGYNLCDVVEYSGSNYASILSHTSATGTNEPPDPTYWTLISTSGP